MLDALLVQDPGDYEIHEIGERADRVIPAGHGRQNDAARFRGLTRCGGGFLSRKKPLLRNDNALLPLLNR